MNQGFNGGSAPTGGPPFFFCYFSLRLRMPIAPFGRDIRRRTILRSAFNPTLRKRVLDCSGMYRAFAQHQPLRTRDRVFPDRHPSEAGALISADRRFVANGHENAQGHGERGREDFVGQQVEGGLADVRPRYSGSPMKISTSQVHCGRTSGSSSPQQAASMAWA